MSIDNNSSQSISLSIESANLEIGWVISTALVELRAETSDGYSSIYIGKNKSGRPGRLIYLGEGALMRAVVEMLKDPMIVSFLSK